jgi:hypothetical protein
MGVNLFVEGRPLPVVLRIRLHRVVRDSQDLLEVARALRDLDTILARDWSKIWNSYQPRSRREVHMISFRVASPPDFSVFADPAWLAVFVSALAGYKNIKENVLEGVNDARKFIAAIRGLTDRELQLLEIAVRLSIGRIAELGERKSTELARKFERIRISLIGREADAESPQIDVRNIEQDEDRHW